MPPVGFKPTITAGKRSQTYAILAYRERNYDNFKRKTLDTPVGNASLYFPCFKIQELRPLPT
jgi:hypothetical protein